MHAKMWQQPACFKVHIAHNNDHNEGNGRGRRNYARLHKHIQDSDDEDEERPEPPPIAVGHIPMINPKYHYTERN